MKTNFNKVFIILSFLLFIKIENESRLIKTNNVFSKYTFESDSICIYNACIEKLKKREMFMPKVYKCPAGYKTIGYGHLVLKGEHFKKIDSSQALKILKEDFNKALTEVNNKFSDSSYKWKLAHAHATFCLGFTRVIKAIKNKDLYKHVYYRKNRRFIKAKSLVEAREFELAIINNKI
jgi:GH24 family phage-related lysozyme (muramidase)